MYKRFCWDPTVRFDWSVANALGKMRPGSKVFWGSTMELFGQWVKPEWMQLILEATKRHSELTHIFLTKQPQNLPREWPPNCYVGVSTTGFDGCSGLEDIFAGIRARVKFVSIEPMLDYTPLDFRWVNWVIIGQQTPVKDSTRPDEHWIEDTVRAADANGTPVFLKDNLRDMALIQPLCYRDHKLRQEFPKVKP